MISSLQLIFVVIGGSGVVIIVVVAVVAGGTGVIFYYSSVVSTMIYDIVIYIFDKYIYSLRRSHFLFGCMMTYLLVKYSCGYSLL